MWSFHKGNYFEKDFSNCFYQTKIICSFTSRTNYPISERGKEQLTIVPEYLMLVISFHCMLIAFTMCFKFFKISLSISQVPITGPVCNLCAGHGWPFIVQSWEHEEVTEVKHHDSLLSVLKLPSFKFCFSG